MRKNIFAGVIIFLVLTAGSARADEMAPKLLGVGGVFCTSPYSGVKSNTTPIPLVSWDHQGFYIRGLEAGYSFYDNKILKLSVITSPRMMGYSSDDSTALNGMEDRRRSWDAGLKAELDIPQVRGMSFNAQILNDVLSRYDGREGEVSLTQAYRTKFMYCKLSAGVKLQSHGLTSYYYGVLADEARSGRLAYTSSSAINPFAGVMISTGFSDKWRVIARAGLEWLDSTITRSPVVDETYTFAGMLGIARKF